MIDEDYVDEYVFEQEIFDGNDIFDYISSILENDEKDMDNLFKKLKERYPERFSWYN